MPLEINTEQFTVIRPPSRWLRLDLKELLSYKELIYFFVWRDLKVRYKQTIIGALWAILQPVVAMIIFTIFFGRFAKIPSDNIPYPVFVYVGLIFWNYFSFGLSRSTDSMVSNASIIQKIYFPRLIIPISAVAVGLVDFFISTLVLGGFMVYYHFTPDLLSALFFLPLLVFMIFLSSLGIGSFLAAVNVKYRDVRYVLPFFTQMLMFITPVIYPLSMLSSKYRWLIALNPMTGIIETARSVIFTNKPIDWQLLGFSMIISVFLFIFGLLYFKRSEVTFADII